MHIAYFITGHGFGHAVRSVIIASHFAPTTRVTFVSDIGDSFFRRELSRRYSLLPYRFDCGCVQSDFITVDKKATLEEYREIVATNEARSDKMVSWCRENAVDGIVSDIVPAAFDIAQRCSIPSLAVTNFTWFDIYEEYLAEYPGFSPILQTMLEQYRKADMLLALSPTLAMNYFNLSESVPVVARRGNLKREQILSKFGIDSNKKIAVIYIGDFGFEEADWNRLSAFSSWEFFGIQTIAGAPDNYHRIDSTQVFYPDLIASADCIFGKLGYSLLAEAMVNGTPVVFLPRSDFAEYRYLEYAIMEWEGGIRLPVEEFISIEWGEALRLVETMTPVPVHSNGAGICAERIEDFIAVNG